MSALAEAIARDILAERPNALVSPSCFVCGRSYSGGDGRFCSRRCREAFDNGFQPYEAQRERYGLPARGEGFLIDCKACRRPFVSKGLRCCSAECERTHREREGIGATMAEVGMEPVGFVKRKCEQCGGDIPRYTGVGKARRLTKKTARFCSPQCYEKARWLVSSGRAVSPAIGAQKCPQNGVRNDRPG
jgi:hypothetical protein